MEGYVVRGVENGARAIEELRRRPYDMVISDLKMPGLDGLQLLDQIAKERLNVISVIMTGFATVETAIEAMKRGAHDYILKPFKIEEVVHVVRKGLEFQNLRKENIRLRAAVTLYEVSQAVATSLDLDQVLDVILKAAQGEVEADVAALYLTDEQSGELVETRVVHSGDGKERDRTCPELVTAEVLGAFERGEEVIASGVRTQRYVRGAELPVSAMAVPVVTGKHLIGVLATFAYARGRTFDEGARKLLSVLATRAAASIEMTRLYGDLVTRNDELTEANEALERNFRQTITALARALEESDPYTRGHSERVAVYSGLIARGLGMSEAEIETVVQSGLLHDIGKIGIKTEMLNKPGKLTPREIALFQEHPDKGKRILEPIPFMKDLIPGVWCHHEHIDGGGYPQGLKSDDIPMLGRLIGIADAYDAMTSDRAYRRALSHEQAIAEIQRCSGTQFDAEFAEVFIREIEKWREEQQASGDPYPF